MLLCSTVFGSNSTIADNDGRPLYLQDSICIATMQQMGLPEINMGRSHGATTNLSQTGFHKVVAQRAHLCLPEIQLVHCHIVLDFLGTLYCCKACKSDQQWSAAKMIVAFGDGLYAPRVKMCLPWAFPEQLLH